MKILIFVVVMKDTILQNVLRLDKYTDILTKIYFLTVYQLTVMASTHISDRKWNYLSKEEAKGICYVTKEIRYFTTSTSKK